MLSVHPIAGDPSQGILGGALYASNDMGRLRWLCARVAYIVLSRARRTEPSDLRVQPAVGLRKDLTKRLWTMPKKKRNSTKKAPGTLATKPDSEGSRTPGVGLEPTTL
jgi:hypothetical protein